MLSFGLHVCYRACTSITCEAFRFVYYNKHNSENADYLINNVMRAKCCLFACMKLTEVAGTASC